MRLRSSTDQTLGAEVRQELGKVGLSSGDDPLQRGLVSGGGRGLVLGLQREVDEVHVGVLHVPGPLRLVASQHVASAV